MKSADAEFKVTEENFQEAVAKAGYWAKKRLYKKMTKACFTRFYDVKEKSMAQVSRPPKDVEQWVANFVQTQHEKA